MAKGTRKAKRGPGRPWPEQDRTTKAERMTARAFNQWLEVMGYSDSDAARKLGTSPSTVAAYRDRGGPGLLALACSALAAGLGEWKPGKGR